MSSLFNNFYEFFSTGKKALSRETFEELEIKIETAYSWSSIEQLINSLSYIPERDAYEIIFDLEGNTEKFTNETDIRVIRKFFDDNQGSSFLTHLTINKKSIDCVSSIYFIELFEEYIKEVGLHKFLIAFNDFFKEKHVFEVFQETTELRTKSIAFTQPSNSLDFDGFYYDRKSVLSNIKENSCFVQGAEKLLATDFLLRERSKTREFLNEVFDKLTVALSISSLSNIFELHNDETMTFKISGYKSIYAEKVCILNYIPVLPHLYKISSWVYENDKCSDKLGIARNIISLYSKEQKSLLDVCEQTWLAIQSNYSIYLKDNVQKYLEVKNKVTDYIFNHEAKIHSITDQLLSSFKSNFLGVLGFIISVVIVNGLRQNGVEIIFSKEYLYIVISLASLSIVWLVFNWFDAKAKRDNSKKIIESTLKRNYENVIDKDEISSYLEPAFKESDKFFESQLIKYIAWWISILALFVFIFTLGNQLLLNKKSEIQSPATPLVMPQKPIDQAWGINNSILPMLSFPKTIEKADKANILSNQNASSNRNEKATTEANK